MGVLLERVMDEPVELTLRVLGHAVPVTARKQGAFWTVTAVGKRHLVTETDRDRRKAMERLTARVEAIIQEHLHARAAAAPREA